MTSGHLIFIPLILLTGAVFGFVIGLRAARDRFNLELKREKERELARAARAERKTRKAKAAAEAGDADEE